MTRRPTSDEDAYRWWRAAMTGQRMPTHINDPQPGWYKTRLVRGGPYIAGRIWLSRTVCSETGELLSDETLCCDIDGKPCDPYERWTWLASRPISEQEYEYLMRLRGYARVHDHNEPLAKPEQSVDLMRVPPPRFSGAKRRT